jgi:chromosome segregation ATPase
MIRRRRRQPQAHAGGRDRGWRLRLLKVMTISATASAATYYVQNDVPPGSIDPAPVSLQTAESAPVAAQRKLERVSQGAEEPSVRLLQFIAARSRWKAERDSNRRLSLPAGFNGMSRNASMIAANEQRLLDARRLAFESRQRDFRLRIAAVREEIQGFVVQRNAKEQEIGILREELRAVEKMRERQLANLPRVLSLKREMARAQWDIGSLDAAVARSRLAIKEIEQEIHESQHRLIVESENEIRDIDLEISAMTKSAVDLPEPLMELAQATIRRSP